MKFSSLAALEEHLQQPQEKGSVYVVIAQDLLERQFLSSMILHALKKQETCLGETRLEEITLDLSVVSPDDLKAALNNRDLFAIKSVLHLKHCDQAPKPLLDILGSAWIEGLDMPWMVLEGESFKQDPKISERLNQKLLIMDLTKEKPWERKQRLLHWVHRFALKHQKTLQEGVLEELYHRCHKDLSLMIQEMEKLICYTEGVSMITEEHLKQICHGEEEYNSWSVAEAIVWEEKGIKQGATHELDLQQFHLMLGQLRYQYHTAITLCELLLSGADQKKIEAHFPTLQSKTLQKYSRRASTLSLGHLKKALQHLFDSEMKAKSQAIDVRFLWMDLLTHLSLTKAP